MPLHPDRIKGGLCTSEELVFDVLERLGPSDVVEIVSALAISPRTVVAALRTLYADGAITTDHRSDTNPDTVYRVAVQHVYYWPGKAALRRWADRQRGTPVTNPDGIEPVEIEESPDD
jgi:DNA-binding transcriptional ArsR family regulator